MTEPPTSPVQAAAKIAESAVGGLVATPIFLTLVLLNCAMIFAAVWYLIKIEDNRQTERARFATILERCLSKSGSP